MDQARLRKLGIAAVLAAALVAVAVIVSLGGSQDGGSPSDDTAEVEELFAGIPQRGEVLGEPGAAATMVEFADLQCPFCRDYTVEVLPELVERYVRPGDLRMSLHLVAILGQDSARAAEVAAAAALQDRMWEFTDLFYRHQGREGSGYVTEEFLREIAEATPGLDAELALEQADSPQAQRVVARADTQASRFGIDSTPSFLLASDGDGGPERLSPASLEADAFAAAIERRLAE